MTLFPVFANLKGRRVLVVGGGVVAERKVSSLLKAGARLIVGAPDLTAELQRLERRGEITVFRGNYESHWLCDAWLVVAATDDCAVNRRVAAEAAQAQIFINVVDDAALSTFQMPSIVDRSPLIIAISSSGGAPMLARRVRERIETLFDHSLGSLTQLAQRYRPSIRRRRPELRRRREFYDWLLDGPVADAVARHQPRLAEYRLEQELRRCRPAATGKVILVGAGPGDPGLLTLKALRALNQADIILHDRLVSPEIRALARRDAIQISVGKSPGENHQATQQRIHQLLLDHAQAGKRVVRLKGGDAFIFGRGGEEVEFLSQHRIDYEVVPGITAALACAAYAGIPLTHRDHAQSVQFLTAHSSQEKDEMDWPSLARSEQTLAIYMGVGQLERISERLIHHGRSAQTPFALIENGTRANQRVLTGTLVDLARLAREHSLQAPCLLVIGEVAALARQLHWFGTRINAGPTTDPVAAMKHDSLTLAA